jgi:UDP-glucose 4-epimerase
MQILITGGAGYIGSHVVKALGKLGHQLTILDNLSTGHRQAVTFGELVVGDLNDEKLLEELFAAKKFDAVLHFAGSIIVPESVENPLKYYSNNTLNSYRLISACVKHKVHQFIFSSTAAVYGMTDDGAASEETAKKPMNPYGHSKLMTEQMLTDTAASSPLRFVALRYFNVSGADPEGQIGQSFPGATHLIKVACETACGKRDHIKVYGTDYPTPDGTCLRDYIHVSDLAEAHVKALDYLVEGHASEIVNCGYGHGFSVKEVIHKVRQITGVNINAIETPRRPGDPAVVMSKAEKIRTLFGWKPKYDDLDLIIKSAYEWEKKGLY